MRLESGLVRHLGALFDPVSQVEVRPRLALTDIDLPEDAIGSKASGGIIGVIERVDGRHSVFEKVNNRDHLELMLLVAKFDQS